MINCYAFGSVPPFAQGLVRDLRVRWALEEAGLPYRVTLVGEREGELPRSEYRAIQPFGQVPAIEDGELTLFESGAIVAYVAERSDSLLPKDAAGRAHAIQWMFAALNTIEMPVQNLAGIDLFYADELWAKERRPGAERGRAEEALRARRLSRRPRASGGTLQRRRRAHGLGAPHPAPHRSRRGAACACPLPAALRGEAGVREGARRSDGRLPRLRAEPLILGM